MCAFSRSGRIIANVCVATTKFTKPCHIYSLLFDSLSHLTFCREEELLLFYYPLFTAKFRPVNIHGVLTKSQALLGLEMNLIWPLP